VQSRGTQRWWLHLVQRVCRELQALDQPQQQLAHLPRKSSRLVPGCLKSRDSCTDNTGYFSQTCAWKQREPDLGDLGLVGGASLSCTIVIRILCLACKVTGRDWSLMQACTLQGHCIMLTCCTRRLPGLLQHTCKVVRVILVLSIHLTGVDAQFFAHAIQWQGLHATQLGLGVCAQVKMRSQKLQAADGTELKISGRKTH
jgi:hypothetical protein